MALAQVNVAGTVRRHGHKLKKALAPPWRRHERYLIASDAGMGSDVFSRTWQGHACWWRKSWYTREQETTCYNLPRLCLGLIVLWQGETALASDLFKECLDLQQQPFSSIMVLSSGCLGAIAWRQGDVLRPLPCWSSVSNRQGAYHTLRRGDLHPGSGDCCHSAR